MPGVQPLETGFCVRQPRGTCWTQQEPEPWTLPLGPAGPALAGHRVTSVYLPGPPPSPRHCPVFITAAHHTLLLDLPQKWPDHSSPLPHSLPWLPLGLWEEPECCQREGNHIPHLPCSSPHPTTSTASSVRVWGFRTPSLKPHFSPPSSPGGSCTSHRTQLSRHSLFKACSPVPRFSALLLALPPPLNTPRQEQLPRVPGTDPAGSSPRLWGPREQVSVASASRAWPRGGLPQGWGPKGSCLPRDPQH